MVNEWERVEMEKTALTVAGAAVASLLTLVLARPVATQVDPDYLPESLKPDISAAVAKESVKSKLSAASAKADAEKKVQKAEADRDLKVKEAELNAELKVEKQKSASRKEADDAVKDLKEKLLEQKKEIQEQLDKRLMADIKEDEKRKASNSLEYKEVLKRIEREKEPHDSWLANEDARNERDLEDIKDAEDRRKKGAKYNTWRQKQIDAFEKRIAPLEKRRKKLIGEK
ncbi:MAG: hypothetical protein FJZ43_02965 [Candidatus Staskawiczbacteria bacterium]|nr:hypothetical protein [Candidatus Staskawiczbacteria bacterium]